MQFSGEETTSRISASQLGTSSWAPAPIFPVAEFIGIPTWSPDTPGSSLRHLAGSPRWNVPKFANGEDVGGRLVEMTWNWFCKPPDSCILCLVGGLEAFL